MRQRPDPALLARLRSRIRALEGPGAEASRPPLSCGAEAIDGALPWGGLPLGCLHEITGEGLGFAAALIARLSEGTVLWCRHGGALRGGELYAPGLASFGLDPERLILVRARREADILWAVQEGLRSGRLAAVVGEVRRLSLSDARRLQLAAEAKGVVCLILPSRTAELVNAVTRWRITPRASGGRRPRWRAELRRCRAAAPRSWLVEWRHETGDFAVVSAPSERAAEPARRGAAVAT